MVNDSPKNNDSSQVHRFQEAARQLGCDEDEAAFDEKLKVIARQKPIAASPESLSRIGLSTCDPA